MRVGIQEDDQLDDATRAFDDLRAEVAVLRRAVEALGPALKENRSPDYSLSLGHIAKAQAAIGTRLETIEGHPALRMTPASSASSSSGWSRTPHVRRGARPRIWSRGFPS